MDVFWHTTPAAPVGTSPAAGLPLLLLDGAEAQAAITAQADHNPDPLALGLHAGHLAYVIYTSGSTGVPKGVMCQHNGLCNLALAQIAAYAVRPESRVLQFVSLSFDVCIAEITVALCGGASLYLAAAGDLLPGQPLLATLRRHRISHASLPTAALAALPPDADLAQVHTLFVGGEALPPALAAHWSARLTLFNAYGPTEATVCATLHQCQPSHTGAVPIGRPLANTQIYILDPHGQPVPLGVAGEIHIGGVQVARGYLHRPELTAQRFIADPFGGDPEGRLYKTGDLGRWLADGNIEFLGRNDFQVKIRGFRIEPGEIEAKLAACAGVRDALVLAREDNPGDPGDPGEKRLVAYLVAQDGVELSIAALREQLSRSLADHMVPAAYVVLPAFPLTPNGKLDRAALPGVDAADTRRAVRAYAAPRNATETTLCRVWAALLGLEQVGINDNFFDLGGHSLLLVKLHKQLASEFPGRLAIADYFKHTTVATLGGYLDKQLEGGGDGTRVASAISRGEARKGRLAGKRRK